MTGGSVHKFHMDGHEEGEGEERDNDEVDETDCDGWRCYWRTERSKVVLRETDGGTEGLWYALQRRTRYAVIGEDLTGPHLTKHGGKFYFKTTNLGEDVIAVCILVPGFDIVNLSRTEWVVRGITLLNGLLEESSGIGVDNNTNPCIPVVDRLTDFHGIVVEF